MSASGSDCDRMSAKGSDCDTVSSSRLDYRAGVAGTAGTVLAVPLFSRLRYASGRLFIARVSVTPF